MMCCVTALDARPDSRQSFSIEGPRVTLFWPRGYGGATCIYLLCEQSRAADRAESRAYDSSRQLVAAGVAVETAGGSKPGALKGEERAAWASNTLEKAFLSGICLSLVSEGRHTLNRTT